MNQPLQYLMRAFQEGPSLKFVHIETSGTVYPDWFRALLADPNYDREWLWFTVSPKFGVLDDMIEQADEIKVLVGEGFDWGKLPLTFGRRRCHDNLYLQPVNGIDRVNFRNTKRAVDLILKARGAPWKLSMQAHKIWEVR